MIALLLVAAAQCSGIAGEHILAGELAAAQPAFRAVPRETRIALAPNAGVRRVLTAAEQQRLALRFHLPLEDPTDVCFERPLRRFSREEALAAMRRTLPDENTRIEIVELSETPVPQGELTFLRAGLSPPPVSSPAAPVRWRGSVRYGAGRTFPVWARVRIVRAYTRVIAAEPLAPGRPIQASQLRVETLEGFPMTSRWLESIDQAAGRAVRQSVPAGRPIDRALLAEPNAIERGQAATAEFDNGSVALRVEVVAESAGRRGDTIVVRNRESGKKLAARIEEDGKLRVLAAGTPRRAPSAKRENP